MCISYGFLFNFFPCAALDYEGITRNRPDTPRLSCPRPPSALFPGPAANPRHRAPETQKGGKISPAASSWWGLPFRESVKPPLFVPVFRDRRLDVWEFFVR